MKVIIIFLFINSLLNSEWIYENENGEIYSTVQNKKIVFKENGIIIENEFIEIRGIENLKVNFKMKNKFKLNLFYDTFSRVGLNCYTEIKYNDLKINIINNKLNLYNIDNIKFYHKNKQVNLLQKYENLFLNKSNSNNIQNELDLDYVTLLDENTRSAATSITNDESGNVYITGRTNGGINSLLIGDFKYNHGGGEDVFIFKFNPKNELQWATYFGSNGNEVGFDIDINNDKLYIAGSTNSAIFPGENEIKSRFVGSNYDAFLSIFDLDGVLIKTIFNGSTGYDSFANIDIDNNGRVWVIGRAYSGKFWTSSNAINPEHLGKYDKIFMGLEGDEVIYSSYIGDSNTDELGDAITTLSNKYVVLAGKENSTGSIHNTGNGKIYIYDIENNSIYNTIKIGNQDDSFTTIQNVYSASENSFYISGYTTNGSLATENAYQQELNDLTLYVAKVDIEGNILNCSYLGGSNKEGEMIGNFIKGGLVFNPASYPNKVVLSGFTNSSDFPVTDNAFQKIKSTNSDAFVCIMDSELTTLEYSSFIGGNNIDRASDIGFTNGSIYVVGMSESGDFPTTEDALIKNVNHNQEFGFLARISVPILEPEANFTISYPTPACLGDEYEIRINSDNDEEFTAEVRMTWPQEMLIGEFNSINSEIVFNDEYDFDEGVEDERIYEIKIKEYDNDIFTESLTFSITYELCCENTVKNNIFKKISFDNIFGKCNTVEYKTDMNFRTSTTSNCPDEFDAFGQLASSFQAERNNSNFFKEPKIKPNMLIGDPLPNVPQRAWYQDNPTRKGTRYKFTAYVCNVEKYDRIDLERKLNFWLGIKNRNQDLVLKRLDDVKYEDDWIELSDEFIAEDNTTELAVWVLGESPGEKVPSYGFGIDDITLIPLPDYNLESAKDTIICEGDINIKLENSFTGDIAKIEWSPTTGLDNPNSITPVASPTESTTYTLKITDKYYCEFVSDIVVEVDPCFDKCTPDISVYLTDKEVMIGDEFCINGVYIPECEIETYLESLVIYFEFDPRLLKFESASTDYEIIKLQDKFILKLIFDEMDFILNQENEFTFCFTTLLGSSNITVLEVTEEEQYNLVDFTNSTIEMEACAFPYRQIKIIQPTDFNLIIDDNLLKINITTEESGQFEFKIIDINGKILRQENFTTNKKEYRQEEILIINLEDLPAGVYFVRMIAPNGKFYTKQFVKV